MKPKNKEEKQGGKNVSKTWFFDLAEKMLSELSGRSGEIVKKRFGFLSEKPLTLEKIGKEYGITRERVRQIVTEALKNVLKKDENPFFEEARRKLVFSLEKNGGIIKESEIVEKLNLDGWKEANAIKFFAALSPEINVVEEKRRISRFWSLSKDSFSEVKNLEKSILEYFEKEKNATGEEEIEKFFLQKFPVLDRKKLLAFLGVIEKIGKNKFGKWGMSDWAEINPKGTREKIYLILKEKGAPLHFSEIAALIDRYGLGRRKAHPQTVHNELIKDDRFVLIGRGIYAMREWGYSEGTVKEVIRQILERSGVPMKKEEILRKVFEIRKVKKTTVMINLNNAKFFKKVNSRYGVK